METILQQPSTPDAVGVPRRITVAEFRAMEFEDDDTFFYELLNGELVKKASPNPFHQIVSGNIYFALRLFISENNLGKIIAAPIDVFLDEYNLLQPDVLFIAQDKKDIVTIDGVMGAPNLVVEIISPSTMKRDRGGKMRVYERFGVQEYWIVDIRTRSVEVYVNTESNGRFDYVLHEVYIADERNPDSPRVVRSLVLKELAMPLEQVFEGV